MPDRYHAQGRVRLQAGWQAVAGLPEERANRGRAPAPRGPDEAEAEEDTQEDAAQSLPRLQQGQTLRATYEVKAKQTQPPPRYNEATLLAAMEGAGKQLDDEALQEVMKDRGLGTPATRASVIETLLDRNYITRQGKQLQPTPLGMDLIARLPVPSIGSAQLTGEWEARLSRMARGEESRAAFMADIATYVRELVTAVKSAPPPVAVALSAPAPTSRAGGRPQRGRAAPGRRGAGRAAQPTAAFGAADDNSGVTSESSSRPSKKRSSATSTRARAPARAAGAKTATAKPRTAKAKSGTTSPKSATAAVKVRTTRTKSATTAATAESPLTRPRAARAKAATTSTKTRASKAKIVTATAPARAVSESSRTSSGAPPARRYSDYDSSRSDPPPPWWDGEPDQCSPGLSRERERGRAPLAANDRATNRDAESRLGAQPTAPFAVAVGRAVEPPLRAPPTAPSAAAVGRAVEPPLACPRCRVGALLWGRRAWGCSNFRACPLVIPYEFRGRRLGERDLRNLIERGESLPMLLIDDSHGTHEIRARLRLSLNNPNGFLAMVPTPTQ